MFGIFSTHPRCSADLPEPPMIDSGRASARLAVAFQRDFGPAFARVPQDGERVFLLTLDRIKRPGDLSVIVTHAGETVALLDAGEAGASLVKAVEALGGIVGVRGVREGVSIELRVPDDVECRELVASSM